MFFLNILVNLQFEELFGNINIKSYKLVIYMKILVKYIYTNQNLIKEKKLNFIHQF